MSEWTELCEIAHRVGTDKAPPAVHYAHNYTPHYSRHFGDLRHEPITLLEIGVFRGASLRMWEEWFTRAKIIGVDIAPMVTFDNERVSTVICDIKGYDSPAVDIVVDDGSHDGEDIVAAWKRLWPKVSPGGWYVIEDLQVHAPSSPATWLLELRTRQLMAGESELAELHAYPRIVFLRKAAE